MNAPENTLAAFELAGQSGFWGIECDTYCTVDGRWFVHHDKTIDRMTDGTGNAKDFTYEEISRLAIVSGNGRESFPPQKVPALEEVLEVCQKYGLHAFIEIELYHHEKDLKTLLQLVEDSGIMQQCAFICFNADDLRAVRNLNQMIPLGFLSDKPPVPEDVELIKELGNAFLDYDYKILTPEVVRQCHEQGIEVSVWTVNSNEIATEFVEAGVDYVTTDTDLHRQL